MVHDAQTGLPRLSRELAAAAGHPCPDRPLRIIQFGEGNFLRCFAGWMIDCANRTGVLDCGIAVVQPLACGTADLLREQDGLYTVILKGLRDSTPYSEQQLITAVQRIINPYVQWRDFLDLAHVESLRWFVSNTTEAGIVYSPCEMSVDRCPDSFPAKLTLLLYERFRHFAASSRHGLQILPCELNAANGRTLREIVLRHIHEWRLGSGFERWVSDCNRFFDTLVDRVVPGYPRQEAEQLERQLGYHDRLMVVGEAFHAWIIEDPHNATAELSLEKAGLAVKRVSDLAPYRERKVRILNGAHTGMVPAALLAGLETVQQMVSHATLGLLLRAMLLEEVIPQLALDPQETRLYAEDVLARFSNPAIRHYLADIALNSVAKFSVRVAPSIVAYYRAHEALPPILCFSLAALITLYRACSDSARRDGVVLYDACIRDDARVVQTFGAAWDDFARQGDSRALVCSLLPMTFGDQVPPDGLAERVASLVQRIARDGVSEVTRSLLVP